MVHICMKQVKEKNLTDFLKFRFFDIKQKKVSLVKSVLFCIKKTKIYLKKVVNNFVRLTIEILELKK